MHHRVMGNQKRMTLEEVRERIHAFRGKQKFDTDDESYAEWMADLNREGKDREHRNRDA